LKKLVGPFLSIGYFYADQRPNKQSKQVADLFFCKALCWEFVNKMLLFKYQEAFLNIMMMYENCETGSE